MKATEILAKRLVVISTWYGCANYEIVDFEVVDDTIKLYYDYHYNGKAHIYVLTFSFDEIEKMLNGEDVIVIVSGEVETKTRYSLISK